MVLQHNVPLAPTVWFKTGGVAEYYGEPTTYQEVAQALAWARDRHMPVTLLGQGANVLVADTGIPGLVLRLGLKNIQATDGPDAQTALVTAQAGVTIQELIDWCLAHGLGGLEDFSGIPGTVGGSVYINIHYFTHLLSDYIVHITAIDRNTGEIVTLTRDQARFGYNDSIFAQGEVYVLDMTCALRTLDPLGQAYAQGRAHEIVRHRRARYPYERTCGSFFRNFFPHEVTLRQQGKPVIWVAYYLDQLGLKGTLRRGNAQVSHQHANMIVTHEGATSQDVVDVARTMQQAVYDRFGIVPVPECQLLGFEPHPLMSEVF